MRILIIADLIAFVLAVLLNAAHAQTTIDLGSIVLEKPGTQTLISPNDTFSMDGRAYITNLPACPDGLQWHVYRADPARLDFVPQYVFTGTVPDGYRVNFRDPVSGNYPSHGATSLICE